MSTTWLPSATLDELVVRMAVYGVASSDELRGCSEDEIEALERRYSLRLPNSYRSYLKTMGHRSGRLFDGDHWLVAYADVLRLTHRERENATREGDDSRRKLDEILGADGLIILDRLAEQFYFIRCSEGDDPPVHYFENFGWETERAYPSVLAWLDATCAEFLGAVMPD
jgi:hypothetical protein